VNRIAIAVLASTAALGLSGCETMVTPRYSISADNNVALKSMNIQGIGVSDFTGPTNFDSNCRAAGPVQVPDGLTHTQYIRKALEDELKVAGAFSDKTARVTLTGAVTRLEFSSTRGLTGGTWVIDLNLKSSNGKSITTSEQYEFASGFIATTACKQTAEAFHPAVQNLIGKIVRSPEFSALVQ